MNLLGDCRNESLVDLLFGSVSELARLIEEHGDEFSIGPVVVRYDAETDIHTFFGRRVV